MWAEELAVVMSAYLLCPGFRCVCPGFRCVPVFGVRERYGTTRYLRAMYRDTKIPYITLWRYSHGHTPIKPLAAEKIEGLRKLKRKERMARINGGIAG
jgi:hypothetical protein